MKKTLLTILSLLLIVGCGKKVHTLYYDNGQKKSEETSTLYTEWYENGQKSEERSKDGKRELHTIWYKNGQKRKEETYKDGKRDGLYASWYENGQKKYEETWNNGKSYRVIHWSEGGDIEYDKIKIGNGTSTWWTIEWDEGKKINVKDKEITINDRKTIKTVWNYKHTGEKLFTTKGEFNYMDGDEHGLRTWWYDNGQKKSEETYTYGYTDGLYTEWYKNGQKKKEGNNYSGEKDGLWTEWYENGQKKSEITLRGIVITKEIRWNEDGVIR